MTETMNRIGDAWQSEAQIRYSELVSLRQRLEDYSKQARDKMDKHAAIEEFGTAEYYRGQEHAYAFASLRVKSVIEQANVRISDPAP